MLGMPGDWWTAFQLDRAVTWFGRYVENKLQETEERNGKITYVNTLEDLLTRKPVNGNEANLEKYRREFGTIKR